MALYLFCLSKLHLERGHSVGEYIYIYISVRCHAQTRGCLMCALSSLRRVLLRMSTRSTSATTLFFCIHRTSHPGPPRSRAYGRWLQRTGILKAQGVGCTSMMKKPSAEVYRSQFSYGCPTAFTWSVRLKER